MHSLPAGRSILLESVYGQSESHYIRENQTQRYRETDAFGVFAVPLQSLCIWRRHCTPMCIPILDPQIRRKTSRRYADIPKKDIPKGDIPKGEIPKGDIPEGEIPEGEISGEWTCTRHGPDDPFLSGFVAVLTAHGQVLQKELHIFVSVSRLV